MSDKFTQALTLMQEAFEDAQTGSEYLARLDIAAEVDGAQQVINAASAVQALRVAQYAGREEEQDATGAWGDVDHGVGHVSDFASDCFGPMLSMGHIAACRKVATFAALASKLPMTLAAMSAGDLDPWRATIIATELTEANAQSCAKVEALIHPRILDEAPGAVTLSSPRSKQSGGSWPASTPTPYGSKPQRNASTGSCTPTPPTYPA